MVSFSKLFVHGVYWSLGILTEPGLACTVSIRACVILLAGLVSTEVRVASSGRSVTSHKTFGFRQHPSASKELLF